jgi:hypothetical protein
LPSYSTFIDNNHKSNLWKITGNHFPKKGIIFPKIRAINIRGKENKTKIINFRLKMK